ncbi:MAG: hypothetical protein JNJ77_18445 [Planctomycetia bacterium]|nr:hypothetical protein [Planctomycetia bacterium]
MNLVLLLLLSLLHVDSFAQDKKSPRALTFIGAFKGEISKVSDKGSKIEVEYKELVTSTTRSANNNTVRGGASGKYRPPVPKEFVFKEKTRELELRVHEDTVIRLLDNAQAPTDNQSTTRRKNSQDSESKQNQTDDDASKSKTGSKTNRKRTESALPGKPGDRTNLSKGQVVIVQVAREDLQGFSRLVATSIIILGEK